MWGQAGDAGAGRWAGNWDILMGENHRAAVPRPPSRPLALTPAPFAGPLAMSGHHVAASGSWTPHSRKAGLQPGKVPRPHPLAFSPAPRAVWTLPPPRGPRKAKHSNMDAWSSPDVGPGGLTQGGGRWEGSGDRETPKIQPQWKVHPQDAVPWEELTFLELVYMSGTILPA